MIDRTISIAPMMDWTDRFDRYFLRLITKHALLYTEMVHVNAVLKGDANRFLQFDTAEHPVALQVGGSCPASLKQVAKIAEDYGYDEINLNVGCPSERVQAGSFGACLMADPELVADCIAAMQAHVSIPVTVKTRIGIDKHDSYQYLYNFINTVQQGGCQVFIIHARSAWLKGLSPKENREIPPLKYDYVYKIKQDFPDLLISINGGIKNYATISEHLQYVDGVMIGREAYNNPYFLATIDRDFYHSQREVLSRKAVIEQYLPYVESQLKQGIKLSNITRHLLGLFQGQIGARAWRRYISDNANKKGADVSVLRNALKQI
jgi:tRNA-dihydrouridine synthase A